MVEYEQNYDEIERKDPEDRNIDPHWDTLVSNPEYREAFNEAEREGYSQEVAHIIANLEVWGVEKAVRKFGEEEVKEVIDVEDYDWDETSESEEVDASRDQEAPDDTNDDEGKESPTLDDF